MRLTVHAGSYAYYAIALCLIAFMPIAGITDTSLLVFESAVSYV